MVCIYCSAPTQVKNSRSRDNDSTIWRRRACAACGAVFTTHEAAQLSTAYVVVRRDGSFSPLSKQKLFVSIYESCKHRKRPIEDASALTDTIMNRVVRMPNNITGSIDVATVQVIAQATLKAFDQVAHTYYTAYYINK
jgi:transcriptional repressor NrdR